MADVTVVIGADSKPMVNAFKQGEKASEDFGKSVEKSGNGAVASLKRIGEVAAGFVIGQGLLKLPGLLKGFAEGAIEDEAATKRLEQALRNVGGAFDDHLGKVNERINAGQKLAFTDDQVRDSFQQLLAATGDVNEALHRQKLAMDLSRGAGISLEAASRMVGKVTEENVQAFKRMGITIEEGASEAEALAAVQKKFAGQSDAYAKSTAGQFAQAKIALSEIGESIGTLILPLITKVAQGFAAIAPEVQGFVTVAVEGIGGKVADGFKKASDFVGGFIGDVKWLVENGGSLMDIVAGDNEPTFWQKLAFAVAQAYPPLRDIAKLTFDALLKVGGIAWDALKDGAEALGKLAGATWDKVDGPLKSLAAITWSAVKDGAEALGKLAGLAWKEMQDAFEALKDLALSSWVPLLERAATAIKTIAEQKVEQVAPQIEEVGKKSWEARLGVDALREAHEKLNEKMKPVRDMVDELQGDILKQLARSLEIAVGGVDGISSAFKDLMTELRPLEPVMRTLGGYMQVELSKSVVFLSGLVVALTAAFDAIVRLLNEQATVTFKAIELAIGLIATQINAAKVVAGELRDMWGAAWEAMQSAMSGPINTILGWIQSAIDKLNTLKSLGNTILPGNPFGGGGSAPTSTSTTGVPVPGGENDQMPGREVFGLNLDYDPSANLGGYFDDRGRFHAAEMVDGAYRQSPGADYIPEDYNQRIYGRKSVTVHIGTVNVRDESEARLEKGNLALYLAAAGVS